MLLRFHNLMRWTLEQKVMWGVSLSHALPHFTLFTNASHLGLGTDIAGHNIQRIWSGVCLQEHIKELEMRAVLLALAHFQTLIAQSVLLIATDNTTVLAYIEKQGGTHSSLLCGLAWQIWTLYYRLHVSLSVPLYPRQTECDSGHIIMSDLFGKYEMATLSGYFLVCLPSVGSSTCGFVCDPPQSATSSICVSIV